MREENSRKIVQEQMKAICSFLCSENRYIPGGGLRSAASLVMIFLPEAQNAQAERPAGQKEYFGRT